MYPLSKSGIQMFQHVLCATDGSAASEHAALLAIDMASKYGAKLTSLFVIDPYPFLGIGSANPMAFEAYVNAAKAMSFSIQEKAQSLGAKSSPQVHIEAVTVEEVSVAAGILKAASDLGCDLIVLGSHGRGAVERMILGSVASKIVNSAKVPVLITR
jgi:nucleotide-binding universal stress UspA family protein